MKKYVAMYVVMFTIRKSVILTAELLPELLLKLFRMTGYVRSAVLARTISLP